MRTVSMISLVGLVCSSRALFVPQKVPPKVAQSARPKAPLRCPRLSMYEVEASSGTVVACSQRKPPKEGAFGEDKVGSLGQYLSEMTSAELATALESRLSHLISAAPSASNPDAVVVALRVDHGANDGAGDDNQEAHSNHGEPRGPPASVKVKRRSPAMVAAGFQDAAGDGLKSR